jgi:nitrite reductase/ring-hydroxylating ferredoxin subunit
VRRIPIGAARDFAIPATLIDVEGQAIIVARLAQGWAAIANRCPHMGLPLRAGRITNEHGRIVITCPFHFSKFDLETGEKLDVMDSPLPSPFSQPIRPAQTFRVHEQDWDLLLELP